MDDSISPIELIYGSMSVLRLGPASVPAFGTTIVSAVPEMLLALRSPRIEVQTTAGIMANPSWCQILDIAVDGVSRKTSSSALVLFGSDTGDLGIVWPGQLLEILIENTSSEIKNAAVVVEGDAARVVHWGLECTASSSGGCSECRWLTTCHHEACERDVERAVTCERERLGMRLSASGLDASPSDVVMPRAARKRIPANEEVITEDALRRLGITRER